MRTFFSPGTISSLAVRIMQCALSVFLLVFTFYNPRFAYQTVLGRIMMTSMLLQAAWSSTMGVFDLCVLRFRRGHLLTIPMLNVFLIFDLLVERTTLVATMMAAGVTITLVQNVGYCTYIDFACWRAVQIVSLAFFIWILDVVSVSTLHRVSRGV